MISSGGGPACGTAAAAALLPVLPCRLHDVVNAELDARSLDIGFQPWYLDRTRVSQI